MCTASSPLINKSPFTLYEVGRGLTNLDSANEIALYPFNLPYPLLVTDIIVRILAADGSNNSDIGIYDAAGNLVAHVGAQHISSTGVISFSIPGGPIIIGPGLYFLAFTSAATNLEWAVGSDGGSTNITTLGTSTTSSGGALPSTITITTSLGNSQVQGCLPTMVLSWMQKVGGRMLRDQCPF